MIRAIAIDDEPLALRVIESHAKKSDNLELIRTTTNAVEGLLEAQSGHIALVFLDIQMPRLDGWGTAKIIREELKLDIQIVALTANDAANDASSFYKAGMNNYLSKPYKKDALIALIQKSETSNDNKRVINVTPRLYGTANIERISSGDTEFVQSIIETFQKNVVLRLAEIEKGLAEKNSEIIQFSLHQLKSSIDILMINGIKGTVLNLEKNIIQKTVTFDQIADEFSAIKTYLLAVKEQMTEKF